MLKKRNKSDHSKQRNKKTMQGRGQSTLSEHVNIIVCIHMYFKKKKQEETKNTSNSNAVVSDPPADFFFYACLDF